MLVSIILDVLVIAIIGLSIFFAYKKGLIRTLFSLVGFIAAIALAFSFLKPVSAWVDAKFVGPMVRNTVLTAINGGDIDKDYDEALSAVDVVSNLREMPESLQNFLEKINVDIDEIVEKAERSDRESIAARERLVDSIASPISSAISETVSLILLIIVFLLILYVATRLLDVIFKVLPLGKSINKLGGVIFGVLRGLAMALIFAAILKGLAAANILIDGEQLENTYLIKLINDLNPLLKWFNK